MARTIEDRTETYEVMENDLRDLESAAGQEKDALAFFTLCLGIVVPTIIGLATTALTTVGLVLYTVTAAVFSIATVWFLVLWIRRRGMARRVLDDIRNRATRRRNVAAAHEWMQSLSGDDRALCDEIMRSDPRCQ